MSVLGVEACHGGAKFAVVWQVKESSKDFEEEVDLTGMYVWW